MVKPSEKISDPTAVGTGLDELVLDSGARIRKDAFCSGAVVVVGVDDTEFEMFDLSAHVERLSSHLLGGRVWPVSSLPGADNPRLQQVRHDCVLEEW